MDHDAAHKHIYALPAVVADLLRLVVPAWADDLDLTTLEDLSPEFFDDEHRRRVGDMVWRVRFRGERDGNDGKPSVLVLIEFQSTVDRAMAKRVREYTELLLERLARQGTVSRESGTPWMLPIVVYNGSERWTAPGEAAALSPVPSARAERDLTALQPQAYRLLTAGRTLTAGGQSAEDWPAANRVAATVRLQRYGGTPQALLSRLREEMARFPGEEDRAFRQALHAWARALEEDRSGVGSLLPSFEELEQPEGGEMTTVFQANWMRWEEGVRARATAEGRRDGLEQGIREGREQGIREGIEQGVEQGIQEGIQRGIRQGIEQGIQEGRERGIERGIEQGVERGVQRGRAEEGARLLGHLTALKFDARTAERLSGLLDHLTGPEDLDRIGGWIIECEHGGELLSRVSALQAPTVSTARASPDAEAADNGASRT